MATGFNRFSVSGGEFIHRNRVKLQKFLRLMPMGYKPHLFG
jgi:hypothetical protein